jgi:hypothetical protein
MSAASATSATGVAWYPLRANTVIARVRTVALRASAVERDPALAVAM